MIKDDIFFLTVCFVATNVLIGYGVFLILEGLREIKKGLDRKRKISDESE